jgi:hypothetical protein
MLWLHIGPPKTGTTAIQAYLRERRDDLSAAGVFYGRQLKGEKPDAPWREVGNGFELGWWLSPARRPRHFSAEAFEQGFRAGLVSEHHPISLISSELIAAATPEALARLRDGPTAGLEVGIIGFARDVYGHALSSWMHAIKHSGGVRDFQAFCRSGYEGPQADAFRRLAETFGRERVRLVHYDTVKDDIVAGFFHALGVEPPQPTASRVANRGLSPVEIEVAMACNRLHANRGGLSLAISRQITTSRPGRGAPMAFDAGAAAILAERFEADVGWINQAFFDGRPTLRIAPGAAEAADDVADVAPVQVWSEAVQALVGALDERAAELRSAQSEIQHLRALEKRRRGELVAARRLAASAVELDPKNQEAAALLAKLDEA